MTEKLTLGPVQFHWPPGQWQDFYFRIADEAPVDRVYLGEVVCSKRAPFYEPLYDEVARRLRSAGKEVVFSTLAEVMIRHDRKMVECMVEMNDTLVEANDASALFHLTGKPHAVGPFMNVYNEDALRVLAGRGAVHTCLPSELPESSLIVMARQAKELDVTLEVQVYGRVPLSLSARCYHARAHGRIKDNCQFVCEQDADGMVLRTLSEQDFLVINGIETMSYACLNLAQELPDLVKMGIRHFRLSPQSHDMIAISRLFRAILDGAMEAGGAIESMAELRPDMPFSNGFYHKRPGHEWVKAAA